MAREYGSYSPAVPLGITWEEVYEMFAPDGVTPVSLAGYDIRAQFRVEKAPLIVMGLPTTAPLFELTTAGSYASLPAWPVFEAFTFQDDDPTTGVILQYVDRDDLWAASVTNERTKLYMSIVLWNPDTNYAIPVIEGRPIFLPAKTIIPGVG